MRPALAGIGLDGGWDVPRKAALASLLPSPLSLWVFLLPYPPNCFDLLLSVLRNLRSHDIGQSNENDTSVYFTTFLENVKTRGSYLYNFLKFFCKFESFSLAMNFDTFDSENPTNF